MKRLASERLRRKFLTLALGGAVAVLVVNFQNCGKAGFDADTTSSSLSRLAGSPTSIDARIHRAPFPLEYSLNHVAYMSCPKSGEVKGDNSLLTRSTFSVRAGAFDNLSYANDFGLGSLSAAEKSYRLQAGMRIRPEFFEYVQNEFKRSDAGILRKVLFERLGDSQGLWQPAVALVNRERSRQEGGFGWDYELIRFLVAPLYEPSFTNHFIQAPPLGTGANEWQRQRVSFFSELDPAERVLMSSISWGKSEQDQKLFLRELRNNLMIAAGFAQTGAQYISDMVDAQGGVEGNINTLMGRGYQLRFSNRPGQGGSWVATDSRFLVGVDEVDTTQKPPRSLSESEGQGWDCFSLIIVRHIDRIDPADPKKRPYCWGGGACAPGPRDASVPGGSVNGVRYVCPPQSTASLNETTSRYGQTVRLNRMRLEMARRVLPAEYWEINTDPNHMCAVMTELGEVYGKCYDSGDSDPQKYIQYNFIQNLPGGETRPCGGNNNECPSFVSICYRCQ